MNWPFGRPQKTGQRQVLKLIGMHCTACALTIDEALEELPGVYQASTSHARAEVVIQFDPQQVSLKQLLAVIQAQGYQAALG